MLKATGGKMGEVVQYVSYPEAYQDLAIGRTDYVVNTLINLQPGAGQARRVRAGPGRVQEDLHRLGGEEGQHGGEGAAGRLPAGARKSGEMAKLQQKWFGLTFDMPEHWTTGNA